MIFASPFHHCFMSIEEKLAYAFDWKQMGADFLTGVAIHFVFKGMDELRTGKKRHIVVSIHLI